MPFKKGGIPWNRGKIGVQKGVWKGKHLPRETRERISSTLRGRKRPDIAEKMRGLRTGYKHSVETRRKMSEAQRGQNHYRWAGGKTAINKQIRKSLEYRLWREAVFQRDNYTCLWCGQRGVKLNADHIKPFALFPELRFAIDNGRTLCEPCHCKTDTWGSR